MDQANPTADLPENELDFNRPTPDQQKKIPLIVKIYGVLCLIDGVISVPVLAIIYTLVIISVVVTPDHMGIGNNPTLSLVIGITGAVLAAIASIGLVVLGWSLIKNRRRNAGLWASILMLVTIGQMITDIMLSGITFDLVTPGIQLLILIALTATLDPSLWQERELERRLATLQDRVAAEEGLLGRDITGEGYIKLNFFNLFWVFLVCSVIGLVLEIIWHMVVVDPGVYQDRAGLLYGPFSPIYGFGALLMTVALNRFYRANPLVIFLVSAVIGGAFEVLVSWFMQLAFGAVAWDYKHATILGLFPDPVAIIFDGRTSTLFAGIWGFLGLVWIRLCLPKLLEVINLIPWRWRYSLTSVSAAIMIVNGFMTLGALDCWFERVSGVEPTTPIEFFYAEHYDNGFMEHRFQSMTIVPRESSRVTASTDHA